jgi:hypothetical protein
LDTESADSVSRLRRDDPSASCGIEYGLGQRIRVPAGMSMDASLIDACSTD